MPVDRAAHTLLYATEPARALLDGGTLVAGLPLLRLAPRGEPHPVLVLPGLLATDSSTAALRHWIRRLGYPVAGWDLGRNRGPTRAVTDGLPRLVRRLADRTGEPVSVVGWSLGGIFARTLAARTPDLVRQVITLGSPFGSQQALAGRPLRPLPVPSTAVYTRWDGVVDWRDCVQRVGPISENVEVRASHLGLGHHPAVLWLVADRLAQPRDRWRPFRPPGRFGLGSLFGRT